MSGDAGRVERPASEMGALESVGKGVRMGDLRFQMADVRQLGCSPRNIRNLGMGDSRFSGFFKDIFFENNPTKLLKTQGRCPESDKTIPISDTFVPWGICPSAAMPHPTTAKIGRHKQDRQAPCGELLHTFSGPEAHERGWEI